MIAAIHGILEQGSFGYADIPRTAYIMANYSALNLASNFTIATKFKFGQTQDASGGLVSWGQSETGKRRGLMIWTGGSGGLFYVYSTNFGSNIKGATPLVFGNWYEAWLTVDAAGVANVYVNGALDGSGTHIMNPYTYSGTNIGRTAYPEYLTGGIEYMKIYNTVLSPSDIPAYRHSLHPNLVAWYELDANANDQSGNNLHGTINGAITFKRL